MAHNHKSMRRAPFIGWNISIFFGNFDNNRWRQYVVCLRESASLISDISDMKKYIRVVLFSFLFRRSVTENLIIQRHYFQDVWSGRNSLLFKSYDKVALFQDKNMQLKILEVQIVNM